MAEQQPQQAGQNNRTPSLNMSATTSGKDLFEGVAGPCAHLGMLFSDVVLPAGVSQLRVCYGLRLSRQGRAVLNPLLKVSRPATSKFANGVTICHGSFR